MSTTKREGEAPAEPLVTRRHPVHGIKYIDGQPTIIFDTMCTRDRVSALANAAFHSVFREVTASATAWLMGRYVIMPDHIHFFAADVGSDIPYENWVKYLKSQLTKSLRRRGAGGRGSPRAIGENSPRAETVAGGRGSRRAVNRESSASAQQELRPPVVIRPHHGDFRWLTDHWDTRVRNAEVYEDKWLYVLNNPVRKGLVPRPEDWPYQGEIFELRWE